MVDVDKQKLNTLLQFAERKLDRDFPITYYKIQPIIKELRGKVNGG